MPQCWENQMSSRMWKLLVNVPSAITIFLGGDSQSSSFYQCISRFPCAILALLYRCLQRMPTVGNWNSHLWINFLLLCEAAWVCSSTEAKIEGNECNRSLGVPQGALERNSWQSAMSTIFLGPCFTTSNRYYSLSYPSQSYIFVLQKQIQNIHDCIH